MKLDNKKVLITGADGFIGSHLTEMLVEHGANIKALSYYNSFNYWGWLEDLDCLNEIEVLTGDVRDASYCKRISKDVDIVFHLAALIAIPYSYIALDSYVDTNIKVPTSRGQSIFAKLLLIMDVNVLSIHPHPKFIAQPNMSPLMNGIHCSPSHHTALQRLVATQWPKASSTPLICQ